MILNYIAERHPHLVPLYSAIYQNGDIRYWFELDEEMRRITENEGLLYVRNDDSMKQTFEAPPIVVNYFFHEKIIPSAKKKSSGLE